MRKAIAILAGVLILASCSTSNHGMDYAKHRQKGAKLQRQSTHRNRSGDLTKWRCPAHRHSGSRGYQGIK
jgi:hypothetical protein